MIHEFDLAPIIFGLTLIVIWGIRVIRDRALFLTPIKVKNPENISFLQHNIIAGIEITRRDIISRIDATSINTALLTAGLISIAFGLA